MVLEYQRLVSEESELTRLAEDDMKQLVAPKSDKHIQVMLNASLGAEHKQRLDTVAASAWSAHKSPAMLQNGFPSEKGRVAQYQDIVQLLPGKSVTLRTLDFVADKQLPYSR